MRTLFRISTIRNIIRFYPTYLNRTFNIGKSLRSRPVIWTTFLAVSWPFKSSETSHSKELQDKLTEADSLFENGQYSECVEFLQQLRRNEFLLHSRGSENPEIMWRVSRCLYNMANDIATDETRKKEMIYEAFDLINAAMKINSNHYAVHKWRGILLDSKSSYMGIKFRIAELENVKNHFMQATRLNPKDGTTLYMLGEWCYQIADMPWYQRTIASTLFATPPVSSFEEALDYFLKAEEVEPRFYSINLLMLGKTYLKLGKTEQAKYYLNLAFQYPAKSNDDHRANKEAKELLRSL